VYVHIIRDIALFIYNNEGRRCMTAWRYQKVECKYEHLGLTLSDVGSLMCSLHAAMRFNGRFGSSFYSSVRQMGTEVSL
jgi:hypothetical protein